MALDDKTLDLYSRQVLVDEIGYDGQERLLSTRLSAGGPVRWRRLAVRYLQAAGLQVVEQEQDSGDGPLTIREASGRNWDIPIMESPGAGMRDLGLALARLLLELVRDDGQPLA